MLISPINYLFKYVSFSNNLKEILSQLNKNFVYPNIDTRVTLLLRDVKDTINYLAIGKGVEKTERCTKDDEAGPELREFSPPVISSRAQNRFLRRSRSSPV